MNLKPRRYFKATYFLALNMTSISLDSDLNTVCGRSLQQNLKQKPQSCISLQISRQGVYCDGRCRVVWGLCRPITFLVRTGVFRSELQCHQGLYSVLFLMSLHTISKIGRQRSGVVLPDHVCLLNRCSTFAL